MLWFTRRRYSPDRGDTGTQSRLAPPPQGFEMGEERHASAKAAAGSPSGRHDETSTRNIAVEKK